MIISKIEIMVHSKAFWSLVGVFVVQGLTAILPELHGTVATVIQSILALITIYQHPKELQVVGSTGRLGSLRINQ